MSETGTCTNIVLTKIEFVPRWLIEYAYDDDIQGLLWHEVRTLTDEQREELIKKFNAVGVAWRMLNLTSLEMSEPFTIEQYLESRAASGDGQ